MNRMISAARLLLVITIVSLSVQVNAQTTFYVNDNSIVGDVFTTALGNNTNAGTATAPFATLQHAVTTASDNDIIYVDAGTYAEQVIINKGITIIGAGQTLTFFTPPATTLVPAPGPFTEIGLFVTTQGIGDVHISNVSINSSGGSQNIIIQSGGSVKNCTLLNGGQGIFFRVDPTIKTALIENNTIQPDGIGINCQGSGLTATIRNNTISKASGYYAGIFAGLDFGPIPQLTIQNNIINNFFGEGILAASFNGTYTSNSITGTGTFAINRNGNGGNTPTATCNWFGSSNAATVATKINGTVIYTPFLTNGTDNSSNVGFQPLGTCGSGNSFYVNDGSAAGDVFTTTTGSDANSGTAAAPFATLQYAVNAAAINDIIYVDAGTYIEQVTITNGITIIGAGQNLTSILKPVTTAPPPGPFPEQGVLQTAQNIGDVNIKDLSVTGDFTVNVTPIIIQSGGSLRNCKLQSGNQGIFVRVDPATNPLAKTFYIEGNTIDAEYIAVNVAGPNLTAILSNNTLTANNTDFSAGIFAGLDFGSIGRITVTNNLFSKYSDDGILISASNASITQNAFTGSGPKAINRIGGANITANCNWYGTANASAVVSKITPGVNYYPWYIDGTDNSPSPGFQHYAETCGPTTNVYYVNDNSTTGDVFTTAIGNDANAGTPTAPLATFGAALTRASAGGVIYMDAGTYVAQDVTINKQVLVIGTNYSASPNTSSNPLLLNSTRNPETIIENTNWIIGADYLAFEGLTFNPLSKQAITLVNTTFSGHRLNRNRFRISSGITQLNFTGSGTTTMAPSAIVNYGLTITDNRFEKEDAITGLSLTVSRFGNVNISNNSFVVTGTTVRTQTAVNAGGSGVVNYLYIGNNTFDRASAAILTSRLAIANITYNKIINTNTAYAGNNALSESSDVSFRYNTLDGSSGIVPFIQYLRQAGDFSGSSSSFKAEDNTITGTAVAGTTTLLGSMNLIFTNSVLNQSLIVRNNKITYNGDLSTIQGQFIRPIMMRGNLKNTIVEKNEITLSGSNLQPANPAINLPVCPAITLYTENGTAAFLQPGSVINILNNKVNGFKHSFTVYDPTAGNDAFIGFGNIPSGVTVNINNNSFTGDSISINNGTVGQPVLATCNWYGSADAAVVVPKISGIAVYSPWLTNGTDTDAAAAGFQPVSNSCNGRQNKFYVNDAIQTGDIFTTAVGNDVNSGIPSAPLLTIDAAFTKAQAGDTIYVDAGFYNLATNLSLNKSITILGSNYLVSPNNTLDKTQYNSSRNSESVITGAAILMGADFININGLRFSSTATAVSLFADYSHIKFDKNFFDVAGSGASLNLQGVSATPIVAFDFSVTDCRFERKDLLFGSNINLGLVKSVWIDNNTFLETPTTGNPYRGIALRTVPNQSVESTVFSNNYVKKVNIPVFTSVIQDWTINNNVFDSCNQGFNHNPGNIVSNNVFLRTNTFTNLRIGRSILARGGVAGSGINNLNIFDNTINQEVDGTNGIVGMIQLDFPAAGNFGSVNISRNKINISGNYNNAFANPNCGIVLIGKHSNTTISENELTFTGINIKYNGLNILPNVPTGIFINTDNGAGSGPIPANAIITITNNKINGFKNSIGMYDPTATGLTAFVGYGNLTTGATVNINNNSFTADSISIDNGVSSQTVGATCNWYGSSAAQNVSPKVTEATVNYTPWLTNGTDNDAATGFQPLPNICNGVPVDADIILVTNVTCNGAANGSIDVLVEEGVAPFTYAWFKDDIAGFSISEDLTNLAPGFYKLIVTDANGSIDSVFATITEPNILTVTSEGVNNLCFGTTNGEATALPVGGTTPYTYVWSSGATTQSISNLAAGVYTVTVTDANGCTTISSYEVTQPTLLTASIVNNSTACSNNATVTAGGGTAPFTFSWSNGATTATINSVPVGTYSVTITDANGCTAIASIALSVGEAFNPSLSVTNVSCFGANNGTITVNNANGTAPFSFSIDGVNFVPGTLPYNFNNLAAGTYTVAVRDVNGCTGFVSKTIIQPTQLVATLGTVQNTCAGANTGGISVTVTGGTTAYNYSWIGPNLFTSTQASISNLATGNYILTVTDKNGCTSIVSATVNAFPAITLTEVISNVSCKGGTNGAINITVGGGTGSGFTYSWSGTFISSNEDLSNLAKGTNYKVRITDNGSGCFIDRTYTITEPATNLSISASRTNVVDCSTLGTITITGSGGTPGYQYSINGINYFPTGLFTGLTPGSYTPWVRDANGCTKSSALLTIADFVNDAYESNNSKGQAKPITIGTGITARIATAADAADWFRFTTTVAGPYTVSLTHPSVAFTYNLFPSSPNNAAALVPVSTTATSKTYTLAAGISYSISVTGGLSVVCYNLVVNSGVAARVNNTTSPVVETVNKTSPVLSIDVLKTAIYPNPHLGSFTIRIESLVEGIGTVEVYTVNGQLLSERKVNLMKGKGNLVPYNNMKQAVLFYRVRIGSHIANGKIVGPN